jgi:hypothetical protein
VSGTSQYLRKPALLVVLIAIVGLGAASAMAALAAGSAAKPFELVFNGGYEWEWADFPVAAGAFSSKAPFCEAGSARDVQFGNGIARRFTCADGSGSITLRLGASGPEWTGDGDWSIVEGTGQYAALRGRGAFRGEGGFSISTFHSTFQGFVDADAVPPTIALAATASKVKGTKNLYMILLALALRDNVEDNPVNYTVIVKRVRTAGVRLASASGEATEGISIPLRVRRPYNGAKTVLIQATAVDPVGNESSLEATVKLPA